jgi:hypothetical protein
VPPPGARIADESDEAFTLPVRPRADGGDRSG